MSSLPPVYYWVTLDYCEIGSQEGYVRREYFAINCLPFKWWRLHREMESLQGRISDRRLRLAGGPASLRCQVFRPRGDLADFKKISREEYLDAAEGGAQSLAFPIESLEEAVRTLRHELDNMGTEPVPRFGPYR